MSTLEQVQQPWRKRWAPEPESDRPACYNRPAFSQTVMSDEFAGLAYPFRMSMDCPHWKPGGNAHVRPHCDSAGGKKTPWRACNGCQWKGKQ